MANVSKGFPKVPSGLSPELSRFLQSVRSALIELQGLLTLFDGLSSGQKSRLLTALRDLEKQNKRIDELSAMARDSDKGLDDIKGLFDAYKHETDARFLAINEVLKQYDTNT